VSQIIPEIVSQHAEEACFLWLLRNDAVYAPHYALADLGRLDARIESHLDGLRASGESGSEIFAEVLGHGGADEIFAAIVFRFATGHHLHTKILFELEHNPAALSDGLISALEWPSYPQAEQHIYKLLSCSIPDLRRVGIAASGIHRRDPGQALSDALADEDLLLRARALRAVGELGRTDLLSSVQKT
jgi:uncharacterized protein (TIGR02270 family)